MKTGVPTVEDLDLDGKRVLVRVDFNVPMRDGEIVDDRRMVAALPTLRYLREHRAKVVVVTHLGRPKGKSNPALSTQQLVKHLGDLLGADVQWCDQVVGDTVKAAVEKLREGDVIMLENVRFEPGEEANDSAFAKQLAELADLWVMDAFGTAHRAHASTEGVGHLIPGAAGFLMAKEIEVLSGILQAPEHPVIAIVGGAKISTKIDLITNLAGRVDKVWIGGAMASTFLRAQGLATGDSLVEADQIQVAADIMKSNPGLALPVDVVVSQHADVASATKVVDVDAIPDGWLAVDAGPKTVAAIREDVAQAKIVIWNGPLGICEIDEYASGTRDVARALAESQATTVVGGGDLAAAVDAAGVADKITHVSTGGGATLEFLEGKQLPGVAVLEAQRVHRV